MSRRVTSNERRAGKKTNKKMLEVQGVWCVVILKIERSRDKSLPEEVLNG